MHKYMKIKQKYGLDVFGAERLKEKRGRGIRKEGIGEED